MIRKDILKDPGHIDNFDFANDFRDTNEWLDTEACFGSDTASAAAVKKRLEYAHQEWAARVVENDSADAKSPIQRAIEKRQNEKNVTAEVEKLKDPSGDKTETEVEKLLEKVGVTRAEIEDGGIDKWVVDDSAMLDPNDPMAILQQANTSESTPKPAEEPEKIPELHWTEELQKEYEKPMIAGAAQASAAAKRVHAELVPEMGIVLGGNGGAISMGFPKEVDTLIVKASLTPEQTKHLLAKFRDLFSMTAKVRNELATVVVTGPEDTLAIAKAKELHTVIRDERLNAEKKKKIIKEPYLRPSQLIDGVFRIWMNEVTPLEQEAKYKAEYVENLEKERKGQLAKERIEKLRLFDAGDTALDLGEIDDATFEMLYQGAVSKYNDRKAEEQRLADEQKKREQEYAAERQRLKEENDRLAKQNADEAARNAELQKIADEEKQKREAIEAENKRKEEARIAEEQRLAAIEEAKRLAPDREKLIAFADEMRNLKYPELESEKAKRFLEIFSDAMMTAINELAKNANSM